MPVVAAPGKGRPGARLVIGGLVLAVVGLLATTGGGVSLAARGTATGGGGASAASMATPLSLDVTWTPGKYVVYLRTENNTLPVDGLAVQVSSDDGFVVASRDVMFLDEFVRDGDTYVSEVELTVTNAGTYHVSIPRPGHRVILVRAGGDSKPGAMIPFLIMLVGALMLVSGAVLVLLGFVRRDVAVQVGRPAGPPPA
jgi:hypothetical protein